MNVKPIAIIVPIIICMLLLFIEGSREPPYHAAAPTDWQGQHAQGLALLSEQGR